MHDLHIHIFELSDFHQYERDREYWKEQSPEQRLSAVEELRRQYAMFSSEEGHDSSKRLRRVLRVVQ
jgi:hypothetical protein